MFRPDITETVDWALKTNYVSTYLPTYLSTYLPTYLSTYLPTYLLTYLPTYRMLNDIKKKEFSTAQLQQDSQLSGGHSGRPSLL